MKKKWLGLGLGILILFTGYFWPETAGLTQPGKMSIAILMAGIVLWVTEVMPLAITALLLMVCMPYFEIFNWSTTWSKFISSVIFFIIATFAISVALIKTSLATRIAGVLIKWSQGNSKRLVLGFMAGTALLSAVCNNVPACSLFMSLALSILITDNAIPGKSNLGKCLMIGIPFGAMIGGTMTPAGTSINIMAMGLLEEATGITISFLDWMLMGIPFAIIIVPVCWLSLIMIFKPEDISQKSIDILQNRVVTTEKLNKEEKKIIIIIAVMLAAWIASTWIPWLDATGIAVMGLIAFFFPGIEVLSWDEFIKGVSWEVVLMIGGVNAVAAGIMSTGAAAWIVDSIMGGASGWSYPMLAGVTATVMAVLHGICPVGPAICGMATVPISGLAELINASPAVLTIIVAFGAGITFLLPLDCVPLITYGKGYYKMVDMVKAGIIPTIAVILVSAFMLPPLGALIGL
ncbi:SLC13 family permease [Desulfitobacterium hafniense]|uniref:Citrate transporter-like domain-containing protein n=2 Tax=Desulfitobacterium hafniense TaxID=49338 RepID=Q24RM0_DESHY|nr:DASS family sodium-coupled anion symporter [Desulfitobacterium hafniense]BAE85322.1 hypothetical protein DSY3533 [Desulfitobacterium hafniense Y51]